MPALTEAQFDAVVDIVEDMLRYERKRSVWSEDSNNGRRLRDRRPQDLIDLKIKHTMDID